MSMTIIDYVMILESLANISQRLRHASGDGKAGTTVPCKCDALRDIADELRDNRNKLRALIPNVSLIEPRKDE